MKYQKLPVVIDAIQLTKQNIDDVIEFVHDKSKIKPCYVNDTVDKISDTPYNSHEAPKNHERIGIIIETLEGKMLVVEGDFIVRGIKGEYYPVKPDIFVKTYVPYIETSL